MKYLRLVFISINLCTTTSCSVIQNEKPLKGKILVEPSQDSTCFIYENSEIKTSFKCKKDNISYYNSFRWLNTRDSLIGYEGIPSKNTMEYSGNIGLFNLSGKLIDYIYKAEKGESALPLFTSKDDKYFIFTTHRELDPEKYPFEAITPMVSLVIMDLEKRQIVQKIDSIGRVPNFNIQESPWLHGGSKFVYSIGENFGLEMEGKRINANIKPNGVYICDIISGERKMLITNGNFAVVSPISNEIAFEKENSIRILDLSTMQEKTVYKLSSKESLIIMHWTPDGKNIYIGYKYGGDYRTVENLIDVKTGKEVPFRCNIAFSYNGYSWK